MTAFSRFHKFSALPVKKRLYEIQAGVFFIPERFKNFQRLKAAGKVKRARFHIRGAANRVGKRFDREIAVAARKIAMCAQPQ